MTRKCITETGQSRQATDSEWHNCRQFRMAKPNGGKHSETGSPDKGIRKNKPQSFGYWRMRSTGNGDGVEIVIWHF